VWSGRLPTMMAWSFASAGEAPAHLRRCWKGRLRDVLTDGGLVYGPRATRRPCKPPHGITLVSQRDIFMMREVGQRVWLSDEHVAQMVCSAGTILAGGKGQMSEGSLFGRVELWTGDRTHHAVTEDALRIIVAQPYRALAYAFLSTTVGLRLLRTAGYGTSIPKMNVDLLADLPFPEVSQDVSLAIAPLVEHAMAAKETAAKAESEAIRIIEEEVLPEWLA
jgi:hypothetical protein